MFLSLLYKYVFVLLSCYLTGQQESRSLRGRPGDPLCPLTARAQRRRERERREEEQQQQKRRREGMREDRKEAAKRNLLRPRQLSMQVRRTNKVWSCFFHCCSIRKFS